jgi:hypothetical protein
MGSVDKESRTRIVERGQRMMTKNMGACTEGGFVKDENVGVGGADRGSTNSSVVEGGDQVCKCFCSR